MAIPHPRQQCHTPTVLAHSSGDATPQWPCNTPPMKPHWNNDTKQCTPPMIPHLIQHNPPLNHYNWFYMDVASDICFTVYDLFWLYMSLWWIFILSQYKNFPWSSKQNSKTTSVLFLKKNMNYAQQCHISGRAWWTQTSSFLSILVMHTGTTSVDCAWLIQSWYFFYVTFKIVHQWSKLSFKKLCKLSTSNHKISHTHSSTTT